MAQIIAKPQIDLRLVFEVDESEARALDALAGYGDDAFIKAFYDLLGKAYMQKHEAGLRKFLTSIRGLVSGPLSQLDDAAKLLRHDMGFDSRDETIETVTRILRRGGISGGDLQDALGGLRARLTYGIWVGRCDSCGRRIGMATSLEGTPTHELLCECGWRGLVTNWDVETFQ